MSGIENDLRILTWDIETSPNVADVWGLFDQNIGLSQVKERQRTICFAAKWHHESAVKFWAEWLPGGNGNRKRAVPKVSARASVSTPSSVDGDETFPGLGKGFVPKGYDRAKVDFDPTTGVGHEAMVRAAWYLLDTADAVVSYNGKSYDSKHMNREFARYGLGRPTPYVHIDLLKVVKAEFKMTSNKLNDVARYFLGDVKAATGGHELWVQVLSGDPRGLRTMARYNQQDVRLTERLYEFFHGQGWIAGHPNMAVGAPEGTCPACGAEDALRRNGTRATLGGMTYARFRCRECGASTTGGRFIDKAASRVTRQ